MISVCSICNQVLGDKEPLEDTRPTHGFCLYCLLFYYAAAGIIGQRLIDAMRSATALDVSYRPVKLLEYGGIHE